MWNILEEAHRSSMWLSSAGSGDVQRIEFLLKEIKEQTQWDDEFPGLQVLTGAIASQAMIGWGEAEYFAEQILAGEFDEDGEEE